MKREIIILTKSRKNGGYCVAGIDYNTSEWVRLSTGCEATLFDSTMKYSDGTSWEIFDVVEVDCNNDWNIPSYHPENITIERDYPFVKKGSVSFDDILARGVETNNTTSILSCPPGERVVTVDYIKQFDNPASIQLIKVDRLEIYADGYSGKRVQRANFVFGGVKYERFSVTDLDYSSLNHNKYIGPAYLIVSRGAPFKSSFSSRKEHYSLIAKVILPNK